MAERLAARLGVKGNRALMTAIIKALRSRKAGIDRLFFDWRGGRVPSDEVYADPAFDDLRAQLAGRQRPLTHPYWADPAPCSMLIEEVEAIWAAIAERDDWAPFEAKVAAIRRMGEALQGSSGA